MNQNHPLFLGYESLEEMLRSVDRKRPIFGLLVAESVRVGQQGFRTDKYIIVVSQPEAGEGLVHYCRLPIAQVRYIGDHAFDSDAERKIERAKGAWLALAGWLAASGYRLVLGVVATPEHMHWLEGEAACLEYNAEMDEYFCKPVEKKPRRTRQKPATDLPDESVQAPGTE